MAQFEFNDDAIAHVLADRALVVPIYQRSYAWTREEVNDFWNDLIDSFRDPQREYFIGNLVLSAEGSTDGVLAIIDGQQRLATTLLLLAALRDENSERGERQAADELHATFISTYDPRSREHRPRLKLNSEDNPFLRQLVVDRDEAQDMQPERASHKLLLDAFSSLRDKVRHFSEGAGDHWYEQLVSLREFLEKRLRVVVVDVSTDADAFLIFETLNDRGADLTIADLLKNYLFRRAGQDLDTVRDAWLMALGSLDVDAENRMFLAFLRHFWSSKHGATRERDLFSGIKSRVTTRAHAVDMAGELRTAASQYAAILSSDHDFWKPHGDSARANIESLNRLNLEQLRPLLLAIMQHFPEAELKLALRALVSWGVRGLVVGGIGGGTAERAYCDAAVRVRGGGVKTAGELLEELDDFVPRDQEFRTVFATRRITNGKVARYYLHALERVAMGVDEPELIPNQDADQVNLEHILPKNPSPDDWPQFDPEEYSTWLHRLGNMVLLQKGPNDRIGNASWDVKRPILQQSQLQLTRTYLKIAEVI